MTKIIFYLSGVLLILSAGCVAIDESGIENAQPDTTAFGPASLAGMWIGESNWDGAIKEIRVLVRKPIVERMVTPTAQAPVTKTETVKDNESGIASPSLTLNKNSKPKGPQPGKPISPTPIAPAWEPVTDNELVFWGWDIFIKGEGKSPFFNLQIIFREDSPGKMTVVSQSGGTGNARFVRDGAERRIEVDLEHPMFKEKEMKGRFLLEGDRINGSFTFFGKEGIFKLVKDNSKPEESQPKQ